MKVIETLVLAIIIIIVIFEKKNHTKLLTSCICVECIVGTEKKEGENINKSSCTLLKTYHIYHIIKQ